MYRLRDLNEDQPWSKGCLDDLINEVWRGESVRYIASFMCRRSDEIVAKARDLGLPLKRPGQ